MLTDLPEHPRKVKNILCCSKQCSVPHVVVRKRQKMAFGRNSVPAIVPRHPVAEYFDVPMVISRLHGALREK